MARKHAGIVSAVLTVIIALYLDRLSHEASS